MKRLTYWALWLVLISFAALVFTLGWYNRMAHDDYGVLMKVHEYGVLGSVGYWYQTWSGRWAANAIIAGLLSVFHNYGGLFLYSLATLIFCLVACRVFIGSVWLRLRQTTLESPLAWGLGGLLSVSLFYLTFDIGETWFWVTASVMYLWTVLACLLGLGWVLSDKQAWWQWVGISLCFLFIGGSNEGYALVLLVALPALLLVKRISKPKLAIAFVALLVGFVILYLAPGNGVRKGYFPEVGLWQTLKVAGVSYKILVKEFIIPKLPYLLLFSLPWAGLGFKSAKPSTGNFLRVAGVIVFATSILCFLAMLPTAYTLVSLGPKRYLMQVSFYLALGVAGMGLCMGYYLGQSKIFPIITPVSLLIIALTLLLTLINQYPIVKRYAAAEDTRITLLLEEKQKGRTEILALDPLPPSGLLKSNEIKEYPDHFSNQNLKAALGLNFEIRVKTWDELESP